MRVVYVELEPASDRGHCFAASDGEGLAHIRVVEVQNEARVLVGVEGGALEGHIGEVEAVVPEHRVLPSRHELHLPEHLFSILGNHRGLRGIILVTQLGHMQLHAFQIVNWLGLVDQKLQHLGEADH